MRTRRIAIACRRTGSTNTVAIAPSASAGAPDPFPADFPMEFLPIDLSAPLPSRIPGADARPKNWMDGHMDAGHIPTPAAPPPGEQDLTLADLTGGANGRRDLDWNRNPGWPADLDWTRIARTARGNSAGNPARGHSPRHRRRLPAVPAVPRRAFAWTGAGIVAAVLLVVLVTLLSELLG